VQTSAHQDKKQHVIHCI